MDNNLGEIIIALTGLATVGAGIYQAIARKTKASNDTMQTNFQKLYDRQGKDIEALQADLKAIRAEQAKERDIWAAERIRFQEKVDSLTSDNTAKKEEIASLRGEVQGLRTALEAQAQTISP